MSNYSKMYVLFSSKKKRTFIPPGAFLKPILRILRNSVLPNPTLKGSTTYCMMIKNSKEGLSKREEKNKILVRYRIELATFMDIIKRAKCINH